MTSIERRLQLWLKRRKLRRLADNINWAKQHIADHESHAAYGRIVVAKCWQQQSRVQSEIWALESPQDIIRRAY